MKLHLPSMHDAQINPIFKAFSDKEVLTLPCSMPRDLLLEECEDRKELPLTGHGCSLSVYPSAAELDCLHSAASSVTTPSRADPCRGTGLCSCTLSCSDQCLLTTELSHIPHASCQKLGWQSQGMPQNCTGLTQSRDSWRFWKASQKAPRENPQSRTSLHRMHAETAIQIIQITGELSNAVSNKELQNGSNKKWQRLVSVWHNYIAALQINKLIRYNITVRTCPMYFD